MIAQEVEKIFPMLVHTDGEGIKSVEYGNLIAPLIEAIKELNANNISQSEEITSLKSEISEMKAAIKLLMKEQK